MSAQIPIPQEAIAAFCERHHIRKLSLFGSVLRADFSPESDVDVLVEFEKGHNVSLFRLIDLQDELSALLGYPIHMNTLQAISPMLQDDILTVAEVQYEKAG